jgi:hypothetical protein
MPRESSGWESDMRRHALQGAHEDAQKTSAEMQAAADAEALKARERRKAGQRTPKEFTPHAEMPGTIPVIRGIPEETRLADVRRKIAEMGDEPIETSRAQAG